MKYLIITLSLIISSACTTDIKHFVKKIPENTMISYIDECKKICIDLGYTQVYRSGFRYSSSILSCHCRYKK